MQARPAIFSSTKVSAIVPFNTPSSQHSSSTHTDAKSDPCAPSPRHQSRHVSSTRPQPLYPREAHIQERGRFDIWMLGVTIVIGGQYFSWNEGFTAGFYSYFLAFLLVAAAYVALCLCIAEIAGALPFAGGAYGLSRCTLGFYPGFLIGCCEALEYIAYVATTVTLFADLVVGAIPSLRGLEPLIWMLFYISALAIQFRGGRVFWGFNLVIGAVSLFIVVVFVMGSVPFVDFPKHVQADRDVGFVNGVDGFLRSLPLASWFFVGVEALPMACDDVLHPRTIVPKAQIMSVFTLAATGLVVFWTSASLPVVGDGGLAKFATVLAPLNAGFQHMFEISSTSATLFSLPAAYATAFGFTWCYGKLIHSMALSRLLPRVLARTTTVTGVPYVALLVGSAISYALCIVVHVAPSIERHLYPVCITSAFVAYTGQCIGYISLKRNYRSIKRSHFASPLGIGGALFSMVVWILGIISIAAFQHDGQVEIVSFLVIVLLLSIFYVAYANKRQTFSPQENRVLLVAHVVKAMGFGSNVRPLVSTAPSGTSNSVCTSQPSDTDGPTPGHAAPQPIATSADGLGTVVSGEWCHEPRVSNGQAQTVDVNSS